MAEPASSDAGTLPRKLKEAKEEVARLEDCLAMVERERTSWKGATVCAVGFGVVCAGVALALSRRDNQLKELLERSRTTLSGKGLRKVVKRILKEGIAAGYEHLVKMQVLYPR